MDDLTLMQVSYCARKVQGNREEGIQIATIHGSRFAQAKAVESLKNEVEIFTTLLEANGFQYPGDVQTFEDFEFSMQRRPLFKGGITDTEMPQDHRALILKAFGPRANRRAAGR
jgi:hypothetical protein